MALDTANKRGSALSTARPWLIGAPFPDGLFDQADRQQIAWAYAGILAGSAGGVRAYASTQFSTVSGAATVLSTVTNATTTED